VEFPNPRTTGQLVMSMHSDVSVVIRIVCLWDVCFFSVRQMTPYSVQQCDVQCERLLFTILVEYLPLRCCYFLLPLPHPLVPLSTHIPRYRAHSRVAQWRRQNFAPGGHGRVVHGFRSLWWQNHPKVKAIWRYVCKNEYDWSFFCNSLPQ